MRELIYSVLQHELCLSRLYHIGKKCKPTGNTHRLILCHLHNAGMGSSMCDYFARTVCLFCGIIVI